MSDTPLTVLGIAGSLRRASFNRGLLRAATELAPPGLTIRTFEPLDAIPLYNEDVEAVGDPPVVRQLKDEIRAADALLFATPEYNYGVPGVLKNAIDWASRPYGKSVLSGKPAAIMGASPGMGGTIRAQLQLRQAFLFIEVYALLKPEVLVARCQDKFDAKGNLTDEATRGVVRQLLEALRDATVRRRG
jgi:chromate reductase, NAD(P)H dehydrogenase (quinone)